MRRLELWILDGSRQCGEAPARPVEEFRRQLQDIGIEILDERSGPAPIIVLTVCGAPTGQAYFFAIADSTSRRQLFEAAQRGFRLEPGDDARQDKNAFAGDEDPFPRMQLSSVLAHPTLIRELVGRPVRVYKRGDPITKDWRPNRVNIVLDPETGRIEDIWFG